MKDINRAMLEAVLDEIGDLRNEVTFLGGAIVGLLITDAHADPTRETDDVDCIAQVGTSVMGFHAVERRLLSLGWTPGSQIQPRDPLCRFRKGPLTIDVVPTEKNILGFAARWGPAAIKQATKHHVGQWQIQVVTAPYFLALKLDAFFDRGRNDFLASHDLEDFIAVLEWRDPIIDEIRSVRNSELIEFLSTSVTKHWDRLVSDAVPANTRADQRRMDIVERRLRIIAGL